MMVDNNKIKKVFNSPSRWVNSPSLSFWMQGSAKLRNFGVQVKCFTKSVKAECPIRSIPVLYLFQHLLFIIAYAAGLLFIAAALSKPNTDRIAAKDTGLHILHSEHQLQSRLRAQEHVPKPHRRSNPL
jgi:hypothetical protein